MRPPIRKRYQLHLDSGRTVEGVLLDRRGGHWSLGNVRVEGPDGKFVTPSGVPQAHVPVERITFVTEVAS